MKILNLDYKIVEESVIDNNNDLLGRINYIDQIIYIKSTLSKEHKKIVLLHETLHSILQQLGFDEEHDNEHLIDSLSTAIYQVLQDNKTTFS